MVHCLAPARFGREVNAAWNLGGAWIKDEKLGAFPSTFQSSYDFAVIYYVD